MDAPGKTFAKLLGILKVRREVVRLAEGEAFVGQAEGAVEGMYGLKVHEAALAKGVKVTGATVHFVNEIPDGGEILLQKAVEVLPDDTPETLQRRVMEQAEWLLLPRAAELVSEQIVKEKSNA